MNEQNNELQIDNTHTLAEALFLANLVPTDENQRTEDVFDIDGALA